MDQKDKTATSRWEQSSVYNPAWKDRSRALISLTNKMGLLRLNEPQVHVAEFGCGYYSPVNDFFADMTNVSVSRFDIKPWDSGVKVVDFNKEWSLDKNFNVGFLSGVLEYLNDVECTLKKLLRHCEVVSFSYAFMPVSVTFKDSDYLNNMSHRINTNGWRNHFSLQDIVKLASSIGTISAIGYWNNQVLFSLRDAK